MIRFFLISVFGLLLPGLAMAAGAGGVEPAYPELQGGGTQYAAFPRPLETYPATEWGIVATLKARAMEEPFNVAATVIFLLAIIHTFLASTLIRISHRFEREHDERLAKLGKRDAMHPDGVPEVSFKATLFHFLGEVEAVFGLWAVVLAGAAVYFHSWEDFKLYVSKDRVFEEPLFVLVIMAIASSRPILRFAEQMMSKAAALGKGSPSAWWLSVLVVAPILGSFITEPAAMTIGAMILARRFYRFEPSPKLAYGTLGLLFVNISVGGTLTHFAAPPVLMVAGKWGWDTGFMAGSFGWKAMIGILISSGTYYLVFRRELFRLSDRADGREDGRIGVPSWEERDDPVPVWITLVHLGFLAWTVYAAHYPVLCIGGFLFFIAFTTATLHHQNSLSLRSPILVAFFLAGLVIHGGCQGWWISPVITSLNDQALMFGSTLLTAFNDNAAITYLAAQVQGISEGAKYAVVAGAVTGGGLTVIANAPNPAGQSILSKFFKDGVSPAGLLLGALAPTAVMYLCYVFLP